MKDAEKSQLHGPGRKTMKRLCACLVAAFLVASCSTTGIKPVFNEKGPVDKTTATGPLNNFYEAEQLSFHAPEESSLAYDFFLAGHHLVRQACTSFFESSGEEQKWALVTRDVVGATGAIGSAALALDDRSRKTVARLALGTAAATLGIDIYSKNFLFGAENIAAVRQLATDALAAHAEIVKSYAEQLTYSSASALLRDNQYQCTYAQLRRLAVDAIAKGKIDRSPPVTLDPLTKGQDEAALFKLGQTLGRPGSVTADEALVLFWLLLDAADPTDQAQICTRLPADIAACKDNQGTKIFDPNWSKAAAARADLKGLSAPTQEAFRALIKAEHGKRQRATAKNAATPMLRAINSLPAQRGGVDSIPINIR